MQNFTQIKKLNIVTKVRNISLSKLLWFTVLPLIQKAHMSKRELIQIRFPYQEIHNNFIKNLQLKMDQLKCTVVDHDEDISGICVEKTCSAGNRLLCVECIQTIHSKCQNRYYSKKELIKRLTELKAQVDLNNSKEIAELRQASQALINSIKSIEQFINNQLQKIQNITQVNMINEILENQKILKASHWRDGYDLLCGQLDNIPQDTKELKSKLDNIKSQIDQLISSKIEPKQIQQLVQSNWNTITNEKALIIKTAHNIIGIALSPDGKHIATAGNVENSIQIWDPNTGKQVGDTLKGHEDRIYSIKYSPCGNFLVSGSQDETIRQWNVSTQKQVGECMKGHQEAISGVEYSSDQKYIVSCSWDETIRIWDTKTGQEQVNKRIQHSNPIQSMCLSKNSNELAFGDYRGNILIWDYDKHLQKGGALQGHTEVITSIQYSSDSKMIVSGSVDKTIRIWDTMTRQQIRQNLIGHTDQIYSVNFSPNTKYIISGSRDKTVRLWDRATEQQIECLSHQQGDVYSTQFSLDGRYIISGSYQDKQLRVMIAPVY